MTSSNAGTGELPSTMAAIFIAKTGGVEELKYSRDVPVPRPSEGEVLIRNEYAGVNFIDTYFRTGLYKAPKFPYILGRECSGTIVAVGSGQTYGLRVGDRVAALAEQAYAGYVAAPAKHTHLLPADVTFAQGAATLLQGVTALSLIREAALPLRAGEWALVHAAAGGTGSWLCQLLRALGMKAIGVASTPEKMTIASDAGATVVLNSSEGDLVARVMHLTDDQGVAAVFDGVGRETWDVSMACLARKGTMVSFGNASGAVPAVQPLALTAKNLRLLRPTVMNYIVTRDEFEGYATEVFSRIGERQIEARVHDIYPLEEASKAHQDLESRGTTGKLLLRL